MKRIVFIIALMLAISSCNKQINKFDYQQFDSTPTLNAILTAGDTIWAQVSLANKLNDVHPTICKDAEVIFYKDGEFLEKLKFDDESQLFLGDNIVESEHSYSCKVVIPDFDTVKARVTVPQYPRITNISIIENAIIDIEGSMHPVFFMTFPVDTSLISYYDAFVEYFYVKYIGRYYLFHGIVNNENADDPLLLDTGVNRLLFSTNTIEDTSYTMKINGFFNPNGEKLIEDNDLQYFHNHVVVKMKSVSESLYNYLKSFYKYYEADPYDNLFLGIINPTNYYSNVENGIGIFGAQACYVSDTIYYNMDR